MYFVPMTWTSVSPAGGGSVGVSAVVAAVALPELSGSAGLELPEVIGAAGVEVAAFSTGCVDVASVVAGRVILSAGDVAAVEPVDVAATSASAGLTTPMPRTKQVAIVRLMAPIHILLL